MLEEFRGQKILNNQEISMCHQHIFDCLRRLVTFSLPSASEFHDRIFPSSFEPITSASNSKIYVLIYRLFGFDMAEKIKRCKETLLRK